jgi:uncharacterized membrane protein YjjP (DUF1212 family)
VAEATAADRQTPPNEAPGGPEAGAAGEAAPRRPAPRHRPSLLSGLRRAPTTLRRVLQALGNESPTDDEPEIPEISPDLVPLLRELGRAMLDSGQSVNDAQDTLKEVADRHGAHTVQTLVLPTCVFIRVQTASGVVTDFTDAVGGGLNLDQIGALFALIRRLRNQTITLADARAELRGIRGRPPRFGAIRTILGHSILTLGFGLILNPTAQLLPVYVVLGLAVGILRWLAARWPTLSTALPVVAAFLMTVVAIQVVYPWLGDSPLQVLVPPLISFLPGSVLTVAAIELTSNQIVSGASRLLYGVAQLLLLVFGVVAGSAVAGSLLQGQEGAHLGWWAPWAGVVLVGVGQMWFSSTPRRSLPWVLVVLFAAYAAQLVGSYVAAEISGFFGALVLVPLATLIERTRTGPPAIVTTLPAFWLLVPGSLSFLGLSELVSGVAGSVADLANAVVAVFAIALGMLVGTALTRDARRVGRTFFTE